MAAQDPNTKLMRAILQGISDSPLALPYAQPNIKFEKPANGAPWASVVMVFNQPAPATCGDEGENEHDGFVQIDLNYPLGEGEAAVTAKADELAEFFKAGARLNYSDVSIVVRSCGRARGREAEGYWRVPMTVTWYTRVQRN